jgi:TolA-binding protein
MKYKEQDEMLRWRERAAERTPAEERAAELIAGALSPVEPSVHKLARVERGLFSSTQPRMPSRLLFRVAIVAAAMIAGAATVKAFEMARRSGWFGLQSPASSREPSKPTSSRAAAKPRRTEALATVPTQGDATKTLPSAEPPSGKPPVAAAPPSNVVASQPTTSSATTTLALRSLPQATTPSQQRSTARATSRDAQLGPSPSPSPLGAEHTHPAPSAQPRLSPPAPAPLSVTPSPLPPAPLPMARAPLPPPPAPTPPAPQAPSGSDEVRALDHAMTLLRRDHDGLGALSALDAYLARYPRGLLSREAHFARVDALLLLGRSDQALADLEVLPLDRGRRSTELLVIRSELRARNSCEKAVSDFGAALSQSPSAALLERILYGRGVCRSKLGDVAGAAEDLGRYVERFPNGVHARSARAWLESLQSRPGHKEQP